MIKQSSVGGARVHRQKYSADKIKAIVETDFHGRVLACDDVVCVICAQE